jgi:hypothetical protein
MLLPSLRLADPSFAWWASQVVLHLRREVAWCRRIDADGRDPAQHALDLLRHREARAQFFASDVAARYLSEQMLAVDPVPGRFEHLADRLGLTPAERFVWALGLLALVDGALGPVVALLEGHAQRSVPTLALAQVMWDEPSEILAALDPARPLRRSGLIAIDGLGSPVAASASLARLLAADASATDLGLRELDRCEAVDPALVRRYAAIPGRLELVALTGPAAADAGGYAAGLAQARPVYGSPLPVDSIAQHLQLAWAFESDLVLLAPLASRDAAQVLAQSLNQVAGLGVRLFVHVTERDHAQSLPPDLLGPVLPIRRQNELERTQRLAAAFPTLGDDVVAIAREFRLEAAETERLATALAAGPPPEKDTLAAAARAECGMDFHGLAELLAPRYRRSDIVLPPAVAAQLDDAIAAIVGAPRLRHEWDRDRRLGEGGVPLLFAGVPGTGKTMAAEVIACETGLPLYRIDLSQVVNKYIGETEKNLARVFDAAEKMRCILFFDEADALFGKRTDVKDANDRFANVETGYLLQRIDAFTGVSVLATNRRKDLDEAFTRRLRYIIEFPVPGADERRAIWDGVFPASIDAGDLDTGFLARQFPFTGGHIRSVALNAALRAAARNSDAKVTMTDVLVATRRELEKLRRKAGADVFGRFWQTIEELRL